MEEVHRSFVARIHAFIGFYSAREQTLMYQTAEVPFRVSLEMYFSKRPNTKREKYFEVQLRTFMIE